MSGVWAALWVAILLGMACGVLGTFVVVRRMALTGDMLSHAVLPGVVAGLAFSPERNPFVVLVFAILMGVAGSFSMKAILRFTRLKPDAAMALVLSAFFALGVALISRFQPSGVNAFLYGQIAAVDQNDLRMLCGVCALTLLVVPLLFRVLRLVSFDPSYARISGCKVRAVETVFFLLLSIVIVVAMQAVGVVLVTAMLVTPAACARFCTVSLRSMTLLACLFGAIGGGVGVLFSARYAQLPTGPLMALSLTVLFTLAFLVGPRGGVLAMFLRRRREVLRILGEDVLKQLWMREEARGREVQLSDGDFHMAHPARVRHSLRTLADDSLVNENEFKVSLTDLGREKAAALVRAHRLWERYLTERVGLKPDHVHDSAERAEHWLDEAGRQKLGEKLGNPEVDPHGSPIPSEPMAESRPR